MGQGETYVINTDMEKSNVWILTARAKKDANQIQKIL